MTRRYPPSSPDIAVYEKFRAKFLDWVNANPGLLVKVGGKSKKSKRHHDATHYDRKYYDTDSAFVFPGTLTDSRQAGWLELMLIQFAHSLGMRQ